MYVLLAQQTLERTVGAFLGKHRVDLVQFNDQIKIINQSININGPIQGTGIVVGNNSSATANDSSKETQ
jgi:hypothetical protein